MSLSAQEFRKSPFLTLLFYIVAFIFLAYATKHFRSYHAPDLDVISYALLFIFSVLKIIVYLVKIFRSKYISGYKLLIHILAVIILLTWDYFSFR
jgi:divalent metal cation (Fe/Co/Zn/Cd) transporter